MNFLAHVHLSGNDHQMMIGNFIGDFVKGRDLVDQFDIQIAKGIELHRAIDDYTDSHDVVQTSKNRLRPKYRHYSGVIVDMFYDHFLAKNWNNYHDVPLEIFADQFYSILNKNVDILPPEVTRMMPYLIQGNWFLNYSKTEGLNRALTGMSRRTSFESKMDQAVADLVKHYPLFEKEFEDFFPQLMKFSKSWIEAH